MQTSYLKPEQYICMAIDKPVEKDSLMSFLMKPNIKPLLSQGLLLILLFMAPRSMLWHILGQGICTKCWVRLVKCVSCFMRSDFLSY